MIKVRDKVKLIFLVWEDILNPKPGQKPRKNLKEATVKKVISDTWFTVECRGVEHNVGFENLEGFENDTKN